MTSRASILGAFCVAAAMIGAAGATSAAIGNELAAPLKTSAQANVLVSGSSISSSVMPAAAFAAGAGSMASPNNAVAFGEAAADSEEAIPATNMAVMLLAAIAAMGLVVVRRSGSR